MCEDNTPKKYLIELVIIFTGICGSFLIDEYREDLEINRQIKKSLGALKPELLSDEQSLKNLIALYYSTEVYYNYIIAEHRFTNL